MKLRSHFLLVIGTLAILAIGLMGGASYQFNKHDALREAKEKGQIILNFLLSTRAYFKDEQRPLIMELIEKDRFYPELMSGFVITRGTWEKFHKLMPDYRFKQATIDPLWPSNKADTDELEIIRFFQENPDDKNKEGLLNKNGEQFYYFAEPKNVSDQGCLRCHGDPLDAPKDQIMIYGSENGYNWKLGEIVSIFIVYVPIENALAAATKKTQMIVGFGAGCVVFILLLIWIFMNSRVVVPIMQLSKRAEEISLGENLAESLQVKNKNEIGILTESIDRLRISMLTLLERCRRE